MITEQRNQPPLFWFLPSVVGFVLFLFSFPNGRPISFWPHWSLAEIFYFWFLFVTPVTTVVGLIAFIKRRRSGHFGKVSAFISVSLLVVSVLANLFMLLAMWAETY